MLNGLRALNGTSGLRTASGSSAPSFLFANGEQGVWISPSDITTLFQDIAGTTRVTDFGQPVGLAKDKSGRGNHASPATPGARLTYVRQPGFLARNLLTYSSDLSNAAWTKNGTTTVSSAGVSTPLGNPAWTITYADTTNLPVQSANMSAKAGEAYTISVWVLAGTAPNVLFRVNPAGIMTTTITPTGAWTRYTLTGVVTADTAAFRVEFLGSTTAAGTVIVGDVQLELGSQASAYQLQGASGAYSEPAVRNLATASADSANTSYWPVSVTNVGITTSKVGSGVDTDGMDYVDIRYAGTSSGVVHSGPYVSDTLTLPAGATTYTYSFVARFIGGSLTGVTGIRPLLNELTSGTFLAANTSASTAASTDTTVSVTATLTTGNQFRPFAQLVFSSGATIDVTFRIKGMQFERGTVRTAYQANVSQYNVTEAGIPNLVGLQFDGAAQFMATPTITHSSDKVQFFAGVRKISDAVRATVFIMSAGGGRVSLEAPWAALNNFGTTNGGTVLVGLSTLVSAPNTSVISVASDIAAPSTTVRRNGSVTNNSSASMGTGNFPSGVVVTIGASAGPTNLFNGILSEFILRFGPNLTANQVTTAERWVDSKTAAY